MSSSLLKSNHSYILYLLLSYNNTFCCAQATPTKTNGDVPTDLEDDISNARQVRRDHPPRKSGRTPQAVCFESHTKA